MKNVYKQVISLCFAYSSFATADLLPNETEIIFEPSKFEAVAAIQGSFQVPENRSNPDSRQITISYVRFPATGKNPGPPIVYLAGGPGGSGILTAKYRSRFPLFMALREFGDVIALDQRGTGASNDIPQCESSQVIAADKRVNDAEYIRFHQVALSECLSFWKEKSIDISGYTTPENVADLDALRQHLGADKITLWGISYGSHLALAALKSMDRYIDKVVIASAEGLDQTIKMPFRTDAYFGRLQAAINTDPELKAVLPDIVGMMQRVNARIEKNPVNIEISMKDGSSIDFLLQRRNLQEFSSMLISDPGRALQLLMLYTAIDQGMTDPLAEVLKTRYTPDEPISYNAMSIAMDIASGIGKQREALVYKQAETSLLGTYLNFTLHLNGVAPELDLGDAFRQAPVSAIPVLLLSGTLDGRTYIESQREAVAGLTNVTSVTLINAGHNLFMSSPLVTETIQQFLRGEPVASDTITVPLPGLPPF